MDCTKVALKASYDDWCIRRERINQGIAIAKKNGKFKGKQANKKLHQKLSNYVVKEILLPKQQEYWKHPSQRLLEFGRSVIKLYFFSLFFS